MVKLATPDNAGRAIMELEQISEISPDLFVAQMSRDVGKQLFKRHVNNVIFELFDYCNRQCSYCPVSLVDRMSEINHISPKHFRQIVDDLEEIDFDNHICLKTFTNIGCTLKDIK